MSDSTIKSIAEFDARYDLLDRIGFRFSVYLFAQPTRPVWIRAQMQKSHRRRPLCSKNNRKEPSAVSEEQERLLQAVKKRDPDNEEIAAPEHHRLHRLLRKRGEALHRDGTMRRRGAVRPDKLEGKLLGERRLCCVEVIINCISYII